MSFCIKFAIPKSSGEPSTGIATKIFETLVVKPLTYFIPKANPNFDDKIMNVTHWLLDFEDGNEIPSREIGLDENGRVLVIMPWNNNHGFWTDNNMTLGDFESSFHTEEISEKEFNKLWNSFENRLS